MIDPVPSEVDLKDMDKNDLYPTTTGTCNKARNVYIIFGMYST